MIIIFIFSNQSSIESQELSESVAYKTQEIISINKDDNNYLIDYNKIIRKIAHFILYFVLGFTVYNFISEFLSNKKLILLTIIICMLYATSDEIHQLFVPGRSFQLIDILIDTFGAITSTILLNLINISNKVNIL